MSADRLTAEELEQLRKDAAEPRDYRDGYETRHQREKRMKRTEPKRRWIESEGRWSE